MGNEIKNIMFIVEGDVQNVAYRDCVAKIARKLKIVGSVENLKDGTVRIECKAKKSTLDKFKKLINLKNPPEYPLIKVENINEEQLDKEIESEIFEVKLGDTTEELASGFSTGMNYLNIFRIQTGLNFKNLDKKYHVISESVLSLTKEIEKSFEGFEKNIQKTNQRIEKTDKNIESLLKILVKRGK